MITVSLLHQMMGRVADSIPGYERAARIFVELGNTRGEAMVLANAAWARHALLGDDERALSDVRAALNTFADIGDVAREAQCREIMAGIAARAGRHEDAQSLFRQSLQGMESSGNRFLLGQHLRAFASFQIDQGEYSEALVTLDEGDRLTEEAGFADLATELLSIRGAALLGIGETDDSLACARAAVDAIGPGTERPYLIYHRLAISASAAGQAEWARDALLKAHEALSSTLADLTDVELQRSLERIPEHAEIVEAAAAVIPRKIEVSLPAKQVASGGPLRPSEMREITWTVGHPDDAELDSTIERRRHRILRLLDEADRSGATPSIEHIADALGVSESTIRRDLGVLREAGHEITTRGSRDRAS